MDIMLSELSQTQKDKYCDSLYEVPTVVRFTETESRMVVVKGLGKGKMRFV